MRTLTNIHSKVCVGACTSHTNGEAALQDVLLT